MTPVQLFAVAASCGATFLALVMLRRRSFRERHAAWWVLAGVAGIVLSLFPGLLDRAAALLGVVDPVNLVLFGATLILFLVCVQLSTEITSLEARVRRLAEESALQADRVDTLQRTVLSLERGLRMERLEARREAVRTGAIELPKLGPHVEPPPQHDTARSVPSDA